MNSLIRQIILLAVVVISGQMSLARNNHKSTSRTATEADVRKADYLFLEAKRHALQERYDSYFELMDYARRLNPDDQEIGMALGLYYLQLDSIGSTRGIDLMQAYVDNHPEDLYNGLTYASVAQRLGQNKRATEAWRKLHERFPDRDGVTLKYATQLRRGNDRDQLLRAIELYDTLEMAGADPGQITGMKASVYLQMGDTAGVLKEARQLLGKSPENSGYNLLVGNIYHTLLDSDSAIIYYDRAVELDPANGLAYYARASYYSEKNDSVAYDREVFEALHQPDLDLEIKLAMLRDYVAELYTDSLQQPRISELFKTLNTQHPHQSAISDLYADYLIAIHDWSGAAEQVNLSLDLEPSDLQKWRALSSLYLQNRDFAKTTDAARQGLHYFPGDIDLYQLQAVGYAGSEDYEKAIEIYMHALDMFENTDSVSNEAVSELYTGLGDTYHQAGNSDKAFESYEKALQLFPDNLTALNNLAYQFACDGRDLQRALAMSEKVCQAKPDDPTSLDTYAWVLFKLKDYPKARTIIDHTLECDSDPSAELFEHAGDIYFMDGMPEEALEFWNKALKLDPDNELLHRKVTHKTYFYK